MPAAKSMAAHENRENCGREWSGPRRTEPCLENATIAMNARTTVPVRM